MSLCLALCGVFTAFAIAKPLVPVQVSITPLQSVGQGQVVEFVVSATVNIDADNLQMVVSLPQTLQLVSGELQWRGSLRKGVEKQLNFAARLSDTSRNTAGDPLIEVRAVLAGAAQPENTNSRPQTRLAASAFYRWHSGIARAATIEALPLNSRVVTRNGIKIQEYPLRP